MRGSSCTSVVFLARCPPPSPPWSLVPAPGCPPLPLPSASPQPPRSLTWCSLQKLSCSPAAFPGPRQLPPVFPLSPSRPLCLLSLCRATTGRHARPRGKGDPGPRLLRAPRPPPTLPPSRLRCGHPVCAPSSFSLEFTLLSSVPVPSTPRRPEQGMFPGDAVGGQVRDKDVATLQATQGARASQRQGPALLPLPGDSHGSRAAGFGEPFLVSGSSHQGGTRDSSRSETFWIVRLEPARRSHDARQRLGEPGCARAVPQGLPADCRSPLPSHPDVQQKEREWRVQR